jgi:hypothetical protein
MKKGTAFIRRKENTHRRMVSLTCSEQDEIQIRIIPFAQSTQVSPKRNAHISGA